MRPRTRSITGAVVMLAIIPIFAGLLACIPEHVPIGNPERARIDPQMSGFWYAGDTEELMGAVIVLQPWDKRTWLVTNVLIEMHDEGETTGIDISTYEGMVAMLESEDVDEDDVQIGALIFKAWLSKFDGQRMMTWESRGVPNDSGGSLEPWLWWDFRVTEVTDTSLGLQMVDGESELFENVPKTQRDWEKVLRRHAKNDVLYEDEPMIYRRVDPEHEELFGGIAGAAIMGEF